MSNQGNKKVPAKQDVTGNRYRRLVVKEFAGVVDGRRAWLCQCDCGNMKVVLGYYLRRHLVGSCGCRQFFTDDQKLSRLVSRLNRRHIKTESGCWEWDGAAVDENGYCQIKIDNVCYYVHRVSYETFIGPIPNEMKVLHRCDNPPCINPEHLFLGTYQDNMNDMVKKDRQARGERHWKAKLTQKEALKLIEMYATGEYSQKQLGEIFGITQSAISSITRGDLWKSSIWNPNENASRQLDTDS